MTIHRRNFLSTSVLAVAGIAFVGKSGAASLLPSSFPFPASAAEKTAFGFLAKYSPDVRTVAGGESGTARFVALIKDVPSFCESIFKARAHGITDLRAYGTLVTFSVNDQRFEVEHLHEPEFVAKVSTRKPDVLS